MSQKQVQENSNGSDTALLDRNDTDIIFEKPKMYQVILLNNDYTHFDAVVNVLLNVFTNRNIRQAQDIMQQAHRTGYSRCIVTTRKRCEEKKTEAINFCTLKDSEEPEKLYGLLEFEVRPMEEE